MISFVSQGLRGYMVFEIKEFIYSTAKNNHFPSRYACQR